MPRSSQSFQAKRHAQRLNQTREAATIPQSYSRVTDGAECESPHPHPRLFEAFRGLPSFQTATEAPRKARVSIMLRMASARRCRRPVCGGETVRISACIDAAGQATKEEIRSVLSPTDSRCECRRNRRANRRRGKPAKACGYRKTGRRAKISEIRGASAIPINLSTRGSP